MELQLVPPAVEYRASFLRAIREFQAEGLPWWRAEVVGLAEPDFAGFVAAKLAEATQTEGIAKTHRWAVAEGEFVGRIAIFHGLDERLRVEGGHIGYDTVPSFRGRGVATEMLRQALPVARGLGLTEVLVTCDETNVGSIRVVEANRGELRETQTPRAGRPAKRYYWIGL